LEQKLSPQMIQSLKLLQMNSMELEVVVKQELESNPLLETLEDGDDPEAPKDEEEEQGIEPSGENQAAKAEELASPEEVQAPETPDQNELDKVIPEDQASKEIDWESYLEEGFDLGSKQTEELESPDERFEKVPVYS